MVINTVLSDELSTNRDTMRLDRQTNISPKSAAGPGFLDGANLKSIRCAELQVGFLCLASIPPGSALVLLDDAAAIQA